jgi:N-methylhydantoinase B/oxoprolinase/acetone carboxylase alpha subunit
MPAEISLSCDRMRFGPWGVFGGGDAMPQALYEVTEDDTPFELGWSPVDVLRPLSGRFDDEDRADSDGTNYRTSKFSHVKVRAGTTLRIVNAGGGGFGDPLDREPELVLADVRNELVSIEDAREHYGVMLTPDGKAIDTEGTRELRKRLRGAERSLKLAGWRDPSWFEGRPG